MIESSQTIRQNEALDLIVSKIFASRSFKVIRVQESQKEVQFQTLSRVHKLYFKMKLLTSYFPKNVS